MKKFSKLKKWYKSPFSAKIHFVFYILIVMFLTNFFINMFVDFP